MFVGIWKAISLASPFKIWRKLREAICHGFEINVAVCVDGKKLFKYISFCLPLQPFTDWWGKRSASSDSIHQGRIPHNPLPSPEDLYNPVPSFCGICFRQQSDGQKCVLQHKLNALSLSRGALLQTLHMPSGVAGALLPKSKEQLNMNI